MKRNYDVVIIDDENSDIATLRASLESYPNMMVKGVARNAAAARKLILAQCPEMIFLDVELPGVSGFDLLNELREQINWRMHVIFYTSHGQYMLKAFRNSAFDFLQKPYMETEFHEVMDRFLEQDRLQMLQPTFRESISGLTPSSHTFMISTARGYRLLRLEQIGYFEHPKTEKQWNVMLYDQTQIQLNRTTTAEDIIAFSPAFVRVSQQAIININYLTLIDGGTCVFDPPFDRKRDIKVSRYYFKGIQDDFDFL